MLSSRDLKFYALALKIAENSDCQQKHGSLIVSGSRIIAMAHNKLRSHPISDRWKIAPDQKRTSHSEQLAIIYSRADIRGMTIYNARLNGTHKSYPCPMCYSLLIEAGIAKLIYFDGEKLVKEKL